MHSFAVHSFICFCAWSHSGTLKKIWLLHISNYVMPDFNSNREQQYKNLYHIAWWALHCNRTCSLIASRHKKCGLIESKMNAVRVRLNFSFRRIIVPILWCVCVLFLDHFIGFYTPLQYKEWHCGRNLLYCIYQFVMKWQKKTCECMLVLASFSLWLQSNEMAIDLFHFEHTF